MGRPISGKHAIEVAAFSCVFDRPFSKTSINALMTLKETFKEEYPVFSTTNIVSMRIEQENTPPQTTQSLSGVSLQILKEGQLTPAWSLRADGNVVVVSCFVYNRWTPESEKALRDLTKVINVVAEDRNTVNHIALQTVDRFVGGGRNDYKINQVFNSNSKFLTRQTQNSGPLWHIYQGWFDELEGSKNRLLHNLNLSTNETPHGIITTIDHNAQHFFVPSAAASDLANEQYLSTIFNKLHSYNKQIVTDLLTKKQCKAIGLC
jgi:uncharacterized protein (TIGR04255 family)